MPLIAAALLVYVCGLYSALSSAGAAAFAAGVVVAWWGGRSARERVALGALLAAGAAAGFAESSRLQACEREASTAHVLQLTIDDDAFPGAFVPARLSCGVSMRVVVRQGTAAAGSVVAASGVIGRGRGGLMMDNATVLIVRGPWVLRTLRDAVGRGIDARFGEDAPMVRALLIADMSDVSPAVRTRFAAAGLSHMLSVSGLHVGLIAAAVLLIAQIGRLSRRRAELLVIALTTLYVLLIGAPLPAVRSAVMLAAGSISSMTQRPTSPWAVLAVGASAPVFDASAAMDIGYQLSVAGMVALVASGALAKRWEFLAQGGWRGNVLRGLATSLTATLLTAPLVASTFGRLSLLAPLTNLAAAPAIAVLQPMLFLAALLLPIPALAQFVADACHPLLAFIDGVAALGAQLPGSSIPVATDALATTLALAGAAALVIACVSRHPGRALVAAGIVVALLVWRPLLNPAALNTEIHVIDVGQGDAIAVRSNKGHWILFDAGREWDGGDAGARDVVPYINRRGGQLEAFVLSHPHADHVGGAASAVRALRPEWYFDPAYAGATGAYRTSLMAARDVGTHWRRAVPGDSLVVDEVVLTVLAPPPGWADTLRDPNLASVVVRLRVGDVSMLFTGDAEAPEEHWLVTHSAGLLHADILKVGHHGSSTSSTDEFLNAVQPRVAVISVGNGNMYHHPSPDVVKSLAAHGALTLRTDRLGTIVLHTDGAGVEVEAGGERWRVK